MRLAFLRVAIVAICLATASCYHLTVKTGRSPTTLFERQKAHMFIFGLVGTEVTVACEAAQIDTERGAADMVLAFLTLGIYTPATVTVYCAPDFDGGDE